MEHFRVANSWRGEPRLGTVWRGTVRRGTAWQSMAWLAKVGRAALAALFMCSPAWSESCTVVTDGTIEIYFHELAHCNGWVHAPFQIGAEPPLELLHDFRGKLNIIISGHDDFETLLAAQTGADIVLSSRPVIEICRRLWKERSIDASTVGRNRIIGCAVKDY